MDEPVEGPEAGVRPSEAASQDWVAEKRRMAKEDAGEDSETLRRESRKPER